MKAPQGGRLEPFTEREKGLIAVGLALLAVDFTTGAMTGAPVPPEKLKEELPTLVGLIDELARDAGEDGIDPLLRGALVAVLDQRAAEADRIG